MLNAKIYHSYYTNTIIRSEIQVNINTLYFQYFSFSLTRS